MPAPLKYGGLSRSPSFTVFYYGASPETAHLLPLGAIMDCVYTPATFAAIETTAATWHKVRYKRILSEVRGKPCKMWEKVAERPLVTDEIEYHQKLLDETP